MPEVKLILEHNLRVRACKEGHVTSGMEEFSLGLGHMVLRGRAAAISVVIKVMPCIKVPIGLFEEREGGEWGREGSLGTKVGKRETETGDG